jgi:hypothetical protein
MTEYFTHLRGGSTIYSGGDGDTVHDSRRALMFHGEDVELVVAQFWREHTGDFVIVPEVGYGVAPRPELSSKRSLTDALRTAKMDPDGRIEQAWKKACEAHGVEWPKRLTKAA